MTKTIRAAGGVVWRVRDDRLEVLLVHRPRYDDWSWPKGKIEKGEALPVAAVREIEEETGCRVALGMPLGVVRYRLVGGDRKETHYWAAHASAERPSLSGCGPVQAASPKEIDRTRWVRVKKAAKLLTYPHDRDPLFALQEAYKKNRLQTRALIVVRHAQACKRAEHDSGEDTRPLTAGRGTAQARQLVALLAAYGVDEVCTSPWKRCTDTIAPYLQRTAIEGIERPELTEAAHASDPEAAAAAAAEQMVETRRCVALCTHRPVLPTVLGVVREAALKPARTAFPTEDPWLKTAEMLVAHAVDTKGGPVVIAVERQRPAV